MLQERVLSWWEQRAAREKSVLAGGAVLLLIVIAWLLIGPATQRREQVEAEIPGLREDLVWMQAQIAEIDQLRGVTDPASPGKAVLTIALVEELLRESGVHGQVSELRPASGQGVLLRFEQVAYAQLMEFLLQLRNRAAARISLASISRLQDQVGMVEASLSLNPATTQ